MESSFSSFYDVYDASDLEAGFSATTMTTSYKHTHRCRNNNNNNNNNKKRNNSILFCEPYEYEDHQSQYFLDSCFLCKKPLSRNKDIFMYRGDTPFCSEECRNEQIEIDEAREKGSKHSSLKNTKEPHRRQQKQGSQRIPVWAW